LLLVAGPFLYDQVSKNASTVLQQNIRRAVAVEIAGADEMLTANHIATDALCDKFYTTATPLLRQIGEQYKTTRRRLPIWKKSRQAERKLYFYVAIDRTGKFAFVQFVRKTGMTSASAVGAKRHQIRTL
jgi:hypothetical protein